MLNNFLYCLRNVRYYDAKARKTAHMAAVWTDGRTVVSLNENYKAPVGIEIREVQGSELWLAPSFVDLYATLNEPGKPWQEQLDNLALSAMAGGFQHLVCYGDTDPKLDTPAAVDSLRPRLKQVALRTGVYIYPMGQLTENGEGKHMAELYSLFMSGVRVFTEGHLGLQDDSLLGRCLQYLKPLGGLVWQVPHSAKLALDGVANESPVTVAFGLKGIPPEAERHAVARALEVLRLTGGQLHFTPITTPEALTLILTAQNEGLQVTCSTAAHYLTLDDSLLTDYDTHLKVIPPLRHITQRDALIEAVKAQQITAFASHHTPLRLEDKEVEFNYAAQGMLGLETAFSVLYTQLVKQSGWNIEALLHWLAVPGRELLHLPLPTLAENTAFDFTLLDLGQTWTVSPQTLKSRRLNSPWMGETLEGRVLPLALPDGF